MTTYQASAFDLQAFEATPLAVVLNGGSYVVTGTDTSLKLSEVVAANAGAYAVAGSDVAFFTQTESSIVGTGGTYAVAGATASVFYNSAVIGLPGTYELDGKTVSLRKSTSTDGFQSDAFQYLSYQMPFAAVSVRVDSASYALSGGEALLRPSVTKLALNSGVYAITGGDAALDTRWYTAAEAGTYAVTGANASLRKPLSTGYVFVWMGNDWKEKPVRVWDGTTWRACPLKFYRNGWRLA
ncbi:MAG: hypothetical protein ABFE08_17790 [Armatimonadia bacterium]